MDGTAWQAFCDTLARTSRFVLGEGVPSSPVDRAEGFRYLTRLLAGGLVTCMEHDDGAWPEFGRMLDHRVKWGLDCPDCLYLYTAVDGDAEYIVSGNRGSANHIDFQVNFGHFAAGDISQWGTVSSISGEELDAAPDGSFEMYLGCDPRERNWLRLEPRARFLLVRQYFNDWESERPADLLIERVGATYPAPRLRPDELASRLDLLRDWLERGGALWEQMSRGALGLAPNSVFFYREQESGQRAGMGGQAYGLGNFHCAPHEAVILEFTPPECRHWNVSLANWFWESFDYSTRQTSLNGHQSTLYDDGAFRAVIAHQDPGVPNWLDASGHDRGTVAIRFLLAGAPVDVRMRAVPFERVRDELPPDTPAIDAQSRAASLRRRHRAALRRYRR
jgi:hypothetical protein